MQEGQSFEMLAAAKPSEVAPVLKLVTEKEHVGNAYHNVDPYRGGYLVQLDIRPSIAQLLHGVVILCSAVPSNREHGVVQA